MGSLETPLCFSSLKTLPGRRLLSFHPYKWILDTLIVSPVVDLRCHTTPLVVKFTKGPLRLPFVLTLREYPLSFLFIFKQIVTIPNSGPQYQHCLRSTRIDITHDPGRVTEPLSCTGKRGSYKMEVYGCILLNFVRKQSYSPLFVFLLFVSK